MKLLVTWTTTVEKTGSGEGKSPHKKTHWWATQVNLHLPRGDHKDNTHLMEKQTKSHQSNTVRKTSTFSIWIQKQSKGGVDTFPEYQRARRKAEFFARSGFCSQKWNFSNFQGPAAGGFGSSQRRCRWSGPRAWEEKKAAGTLQLHV